MKHYIKLTDPVPFKESYRRIPPQMYDEVKSHIQEMLDLGAIRPSNSPWASAIVLVRKKDGRLRFCIDLRRLNNRTVKDAYSLPKIESILDSLIGAQIFSTLDLKAGYWQVEMAEECKAYTAFTCGPLGFYECDTMPFGATNAPATFQRLMHDCLGNLNMNWCIVYVVPPQSWGDRSDTKHSKCLLLGGWRLNQLTLIPKPKGSGGARAAMAQVGPANKRNDTKRCLPVEASLRPGEAVPW